MRLKTVPLSPSSGSAGIQQLSKQRPVSHSSLSRVSLVTHARRQSIMKYLYARAAPTRGERVRCVDFGSDVLDTFKPSAQTR